jgi:hypothetical protein
MDTNARVLTDLELTLRTHGKASIRFAITHDQNGCLAGSGYVSLTNVYEFPNNLRVSFHHPPTDQHPSGANLTFDIPSTLIASIRRIGEDSNTYFTCSTDPFGAPIEFDSLNYSNSQ